MAIENLWPFGGKKKKQSKQQQQTTDASYSSLTKVLVPVEQLRLGMYITELDRPWVETSFLFQGFELKTEAELRAVKDICNHVYIDTTKKRTPTKDTTNNTQVNTEKGKKPAQTQKVFTVEKSIDYLNYGTPPQKLGEFEKEIFRAEKAYQNADMVVRTL